MSFPHHLSAVVAGNNDWGSGAAELEMELHVVQHHRLCSEYSVAKGTPELSVDIGAHVLDENLSNGVLFDRFFYLELAPHAKLGQYGWDVLRINVISERWFCWRERKIPFTELAL